MAQVLNTSLNDLDNAIVQRGVLETRYINNIKRGLSDIIKRLINCNRTTALALQNGSMTTAQRDAITSRIEAAATQLERLTPLNANNRESENLIGRLRDYSRTNLTAVDDPRERDQRRTLNVDNIFNNVTQGSPQRPALPASSVRSREPSISTQPNGTTSSWGWPSFGSKPSSTSQQIGSTKLSGMDDRTEAGIRPRGSFDTVNYGFSPAIGGNRLKKSTRKTLKRR